MTTDIDSEIRSTLRRWAADVTVGEVDPADASLTRAFPPADRRHRAPLVGAAAAIVVAGGIVAALLARPGPTRVHTTGVAGTPGAGVTKSTVPDATKPSVPGTTLGQPAMIVLSGAPGWHLSYFLDVPGGPQLRYTEYHFTNAKGGYLQVSFYPPGTRGHQSLHPMAIEVRGVTGVLTQEGARRYRIDWTELGRTWEVDGSPFANPQALVSLVAHLRVVDRATWKASLPAAASPVAAAVTAHPHLEVSWSAGSPVTCSSPPVVAGGAAFASTTTTSPVAAGRRC